MLNLEAIIWFITTALAVSAAAFRILGPLVGLAARQRALELRRQEAEHNRLAALEHEITVLRELLRRCQNDKP